MSTVDLTNEDDKYKFPLWKFVTKSKQAAQKKGGGNSKFECNFCDTVYNGSYSRVKAHLLKIPGQGIQACKNITNANKAKIDKVMLEAEEMVKRNLPTEVPLPTKNNQTMGGEMGGLDGSGTSTQKKRKGSAIEEAFNKNARDEIHAEIARMFYSGGLPFHLAKNPHYRRAFSLVSLRKVSGYVPPGYNALRTTLLQEEKSNIQMRLAPIRYSWKTKGVTIACDGWSDPQRRPIINFMAICDSGPMFLKAVNCQGEYKDKNFIAALIKEVILEVGEDNVVQVITDNAPVCKGAGLLIEGQFPKIYWTPCVVHTLNLALKSICGAKNSTTNVELHENCRWITYIADDCLMIKNFVMNHSMRLAIFNVHNDLKLLSVAETRFASTIIMIRRFKLIRVRLREMVISDEWNSYKEDDHQRAANIREIILDEGWWRQVDYIIAITEPMIDMLRYTDTDAPCLHLIYDMWDTMIEKVKKVIYKAENLDKEDYSPLFTVIFDVLVARWTKSNTLYIAWLIL